MNSSRLREIVDLLLDLETRLEIQTKLNEANGLLQNIISQPQQPDFQTQFSTTVEQLRGAAAHIREKLQPTQISLIEEIGGEKFFVVDLAALIDEWVQAVERKADDLVAQIVDKSERAREQRQHLKMSLESILARTERGMTVEIRFLPPATTTGADGTTTVEAAAFDSLNKITPQLVFRKTAENPILPLPHAEQK